MLLASKYYKKNFEQESPKCPSTRNELLFQMAASDFVGEALEARNVSRMSGRRTESASFALGQSLKAMTLREENGVENAE